MDRGGAWCAQRGGGGGGGGGKVACGRTDERVVRFVARCFAFHARLGVRPT